MKSDFEKVCTNCENKYIFNELYEIIGEDLEYCTKCLEIKMENGELPPFTNEQMEKIASEVMKNAMSKPGGKNMSDFEAAFGKEYDGTEGGHMGSRIISPLQPAKKDINFGKSLNDIALSGTMVPVIGREKEIEETMMILSRKFKSNPLLVGDPGVGKTTIVEGIAQRIVNKDVPKHLQGKTIVEINVGELLSGTKYRGEFEEKVMKILTEVSKREDIILFIDEFHNLMGAGGAEGAMDAVEILKPYIARNQVQIIGATTYEEYRKHIMGDGAFSRRVQVVDVGEPNEEETTLIIQGIKSMLEEHHNVDIDTETIRHAVKLSNRYLTEKKQPDKAIDLIDEASAFKKIVRKEDREELKKLEAMLKDIKRMKDRYIIEDRFQEAKVELENENKLERKIREKRKELDRRNKENAFVTKEEINQILERKTGIPVTQIDVKNKEILKHLETNLKKKIKGQDEAVQEVTRFIKRSRLNLKDPKRPNGVFLFLGPTGVGKTELTKALANEMFGTEKSMIRFDMSEFMEKTAANKFVGSSPGYVGYDEGGELTNQLRRNPYSIVLLDEVEKAHPDVLNMMLQVFEDGIITDNKGNTVDAKNAVFIMTSNAGVSSIYKKGLGFGATEEKETKEIAKQKVMDTIKRDQSFRPELLNRIDSIVVFNALTDEAMSAIVDNLADEFVARVGNEGYQLTITKEAKDLLKKEGYKPEYGARELKRKIENISDLLTDAILENDKNKYTVTTKGDKLVVN